MKRMSGAAFDAYWQALSKGREDGGLMATVQDIISQVRRDGDRAVWRFTRQFDQGSPETLEVPPKLVQEAGEQFKQAEPELVAALETAAEHIRDFAGCQKAQFVNFEYALAPGLFTGQRVIPVQRAAVYVPAGRFPLISTVLMGVIPALVAGVAEVMVSSPPLATGLPDRRIMAAAHLAGVRRVFAMGGAQAIAALAIGTETVPRADVIVGPGNKYVAAAKRLLFGEVGIDLVAGPTDVLIIAEDQADLIAADMLAQAEHDPEARARALVPSPVLADQVLQRLEARLFGLPTAAIAKASLDAGGLMIIYQSKEEAIRIANAIAPEHLELHVAEPEAWVPHLNNYGSLFMGKGAVEALGDYAAGINHTLPTSGSARFTGGLSVRHFLKTLTTLRCTPGPGYDQACEAAERIARAEGLMAHAESVLSRGAGNAPCGEAEVSIV
ncbi:MAG: histidinol dehydrogenase [Spirochaetaceae bacterium]|jgi:histidinol dehydrogenase|nr:histidinol dehydrogenase [Spirochaetaceae bacterium]